MRASPSRNRAVSTSRWAAPDSSIRSPACPITCNTAHRIQIESRNGGLVNEAGSSPTGALRNRLDFSVSLEWAGTSAGFDTSTARTVQTLVGNAATGTAQIGIRIPGGGTPLVAGIYNDTVTIRVEATS